MRRILKNRNCSIRGKGFSGCGELRRKLGSHINLFADLGVTRVVVCHDADGHDPQTIRREIEGIIRAYGCSGLPCGIVIPVQELEAWIIADGAAVSRVIQTLRIRDVSTPESIDSPKEWLVRESRRGRSSPIYIPSLHNQKVAKHLDLAKLEKKCPSFKPLKDFLLARNKKRK